MAIDVKRTAISSSNNQNERQSDFDLFGNSLKRIYQFLFVTKRRNLHFQK